MWVMFITGLAAGIAAAPHCLGMCGGFPLYIAGSSPGRSSLLRQALFVLAKAFTYVFLGALASALGVILFRNTSLASGAVYMRFAAGAITVLFGLGMLGLRIPAIRFFRSLSGPDLSSGAMSSLISSRSLFAPFVLGLFVGFIPCPLPMGMLAIAAASHTIPQGIALMAGVGVGTAPALLGVGILGAGIDRRFARLGMRAAGVVVLCIGLLTLGRATQAVINAHQSGGSVPACCREMNR